MKGEKALERKSLPVKELEKMWIAALRLVNCWGAVETSLQDCAIMRRLPSLRLAVLIITKSRAYTGCLRGTKCRQRRDFINSLKHRL